MSNNRSRTLAAIIAGVLATAAAPAVVAAEGAKPELENIVVTGTRVADRSATETSVPIDVVSAEALANVGVTELNQALSSVLPSFNFMLTYNTGAAFSFLAGAGGWQRWFFLGLGSLVSIGLIIWLRRLKPGEKWLAVALALILGGAVGNLIDRAWLGQVIDFIQLYYDRWYWPAFNVADSAITVGAALLVLDSLWSRNAGDLKDPAA